MATCIFCGSKNVQCSISKMPPKPDVIPIGKCYCPDCQKEFQT